METLLISLIVIFVATTIAAAFAVVKSHANISALSAHKARLEEREASLNQQLTALTAQREADAAAHIREIAARDAAIAELKTQHQKELEKRDAEQREQREREERFHAAEEERRKQEREAQSDLFKRIANEILEDNSKKFKESNETRIDEILRPFKENISSLQKSITDYYTGEVKEMAVLKESISQLRDLNKTIGQEAQELSKALRGNSKVQGDWGEMILRELLEKSGLIEGENFVLQATTNADGSKIVSDNGSQLRPDCIFYLPESKCIVIDSKASLTAYTEFVNAEGDAQKDALSSHIASVKRHIDELAQKQYQKHVKNSAEFVMMFIPNEGAYSLALQSEQDVWYYAYNKGIILVSPTHLISVLKLMHQLWDRHNQNKHALEIARQAGNMLDKITGFFEDMDKISAQLDKTRDLVSEANKKLRTGTGNLLSRARKMQEMGAKGKKSLPASEDDLPDGLEPDDVSDSPTD